MKALAATVIALLMVTFPLTGCLKRTLGTATAPGARTPESSLGPSASSATETGEDTGLTASPPSATIVTITLTNKTKVPLQLTLSDAAV